MSNMVVLRKADGTAFLIFRDGPNAFATGQYRLALEYRRDISAADPHAPVLSEQGVEDSEHTQIDMPWLTAP